MAEYRFTPRAEQDLRAIWRDIAQHDERAADALLLRIFDRLDLTLTQPLMGVARRDLSPTARILIEGNYILIYEPTDFGFLVIAIVHGMRDPRNWL